MASPPFSINEALPGDSDIVSQHPTNARTFRDVVESWFLVDGNTSGRHDKLGLDWKANPTGTSSVSTFWASTIGRLFYRVGTGTVREVGVPIGTIAYTIRTTVPDDSWMFPAAQAISRTTYADLFALIGTTYGTGDGATTFNLPDLRGRLLVTHDLNDGLAANRVTTAGSGVDGATQGGTGGSQNITLDTTQIPSHTHIENPHSHPFTYQNSGTAGGGNSSTNSIAATGLALTAATDNTTATLQNTGGGLSHINMPPVMVQKAMLKVL